MSIRENPDNYIPCFFFDMKHLLDIKSNGGTYIYSSCEAFNEEMEIDFRRLWHWLRRFNISPCGFSMEKGDGGDYDPIFDGRYHASGHTSTDDITWVINQVDPDIECLSILRHGRIDLFSTALLTSKRLIS
jgi:ribonuclease J